MKRRTILSCLMLIGSLLASHNSLFSMKWLRPLSEEAYSLADMVDTVPALVDVFFEEWIAENSDPGTIIGGLRARGYSSRISRTIVRGIRNRAIIVSNRTAENANFKLTLQGRRLSIVVPANQRRFLDLGQEVSSTGPRIQVQAFSVYLRSPATTGVFKMSMPYIWVRGGDVVRLLPSTDRLSFHPIIQGPAQFQ